MDREHNSTPRSAFHHIRLLSSSCTLGWEDVSLASEGVKEAQAAGKLLKAHGFTFDVVYTRYSTALHHSTVYLIKRLTVEAFEDIYRHWSASLSTSSLILSHDMLTFGIPHPSYDTLNNARHFSTQLSWLSRAIETAWLVLDELDSLWLPIIKTWRLNERWWSVISCWIDSLGECFEWYRSGRPTVLSFSLSLFLLFSAFSLFLSLLFSLFFTLYVLSQDSVALSSTLCNTPSALSLVYHSLWRTTHTHTHIT